VSGCVRRPCFAFATSPQGPSAHSRIEGATRDPRSDRRNSTQASGGSHVPKESLPFDEAGIASEIAPGQPPAQEDRKATKQGVARAEEERVELRAAMS